jgi:hypothetical protein
MNDYRIPSTDYRSPQGRYRNDPQFHALVDMFAAHIHECNFTPSEVRLAGMLACCIHEEMRTRSMIIPMTPEIDETLHKLHMMIETEKGEV